MTPEEATHLGARMSRQFPYNVLHPVWDPQRSWGIVMKDKETGQVLGLWFDRWDAKTWLDKYIGEDNHP